MTYVSEEPLYILSPCDSGPPLASNGGRMNIGKASEDGSPLLISHVSGGDGHSVILKIYFTRKRADFSSLAQPIDPAAVEEKLRASGMLRSF